MIQESYVTFEQAKALKELGFDAVCNSHYMITPFEDIGKGEGPRRDWNSGSQPSTPGCFYLSAPTLSLVQKWLREVKNLFIAIEIDSISNIQYKKEIPYWTMNLYKFYPVAGQMMMLDGSGEDFETYEQALSAGIDKCIELLKQ